MRCFEVFDHMHILFNHKKTPKGKSDESTLVSELAVSAQKWFKIAPQKKVDSWVFANHPAVHSVGVSRLRPLALMTCDR